MSADAAERKLTGWHVLAICVAAFGVIIGVNVLLAVKAVTTFPGLEVENSYVASQVFDSERAAQQALGWRLERSYEGGHLVLAFTDAAGAAVELGDLTATVGHTTEAADDRTPVFAFQDGRYVAPLTLTRGRWMVMVEAHAKDGTRFHQRLDLYVKG